jgi:hypothetical protein
MEFQKSRTGKRGVGPTCGFTASPKVGMGANVGTLQTEYPRVQTSSQDKGWVMQPHAATCPVALGHASLLSRALVLPCVSWLQTLPLCLGGVWHYHASHSSRPCLPT